MTLLDQKAADLNGIVQDIVKQIKCVDDAVANGPHTELNMQELRVVELLGVEGPQMMREISKHLSVAVNTVTNIVDNLERKGTVRRIRSEEDRRVIRVDLTDVGRKAYKASADAHLQFLRTMLKALTEDEQEIFLVLFRKIARAGRSQVQKMASSA
jgi:DNA-binding MarR family transcriptional regulator